MSKEQETIKSSQADLKKQREFLDIKKKKIQNSLEELNRQVEESKERIEKRREMERRREIEKHER